MKYRIDSIRFGFANNSSSTHSILVGCKVGSIPTDNYGWEWFHLKSPAEKKHYIYSQCYANQMGGYDDAVALESLAEKPLVQLLGPVQGETYGVDHQSQGTIPGSGPDAAYLRLVNNPLFSIRGGSDNGDTPACFKDAMEIHFEDILSLQIRKDGDVQVAFNRNNGTKVRFVPEGTPYTHSTYPELVDLKITDFCPHNCPFCYMGSTAQGKHAPKERLFAIIDQLAKVGVFEIAIGGGEPTLHPDFPEILAYAHDRGVTPNFTTYDLAFQKRPKVIAAVKKYAGGFAVSTPFTRADVHKDLFPKITLQIPLGGYSQATIEKALTQAAQDDIPVTLLGYKTVGRGATTPAQPCTNLLEVITNQYLTFGADTAFIANHRAELIRMGVSPKRMVGAEGQFSCYIDGVTNTMGASSYAHTLHPVDLDNLWAQYPYTA